LSSLLVIPSIPIATGIAILRYRLYDIDLLINCALVYGLLTVLLAAAYVGSVVGLQAFFRAITGQESTLTIVASTLAIAALFGPLRRWVQASVDRRFYRRKYDAAKTLEAFGSRLRDETDLDALSYDLVGVASRTVQPAHVSLWLRPDAEPETRNAATRGFDHE
jgi:type III secretory pathway component EscS